MFPKEKKKEKSLRADWSKTDDDKGDGSRRKIKAVSALSGNNI